MQTVAQSADQLQARERQGCQNRLTGPWNPYGKCCGLRCSPSEVAEEQPASVSPAMSSCGPSRCCIAAADTPFPLMCLPRWSWVSFPLQWLWPHLMDEGTEAECHIAALRIYQGLDDGKQKSARRSGIVACISPFLRSGKQMRRDESFLLKKRFDINGPGDRQPDRSLVWFHFYLEVEKGTTRRS